MTDGIESALGCLTVLCIAIAVVYAILAAHEYGQLSIQSQAVELRHAQWVVDSYGNTEFQWNEQ